MDELSEQIKRMPEAVWKKVKDLLQVSTKAQAVKLVEENPGVAERLRTLLASSGGSFLTGPTAPQTEPSLAERVYPKKKQGATLEF